ncbi:hypothetical protein TCAL_06130 [Tigriopus californicus]|uniref:C-type lectin domain-containing protein n=2 Tax=Tigriopus californicus TaxID=6832 RepID=A0A553NYU8_TIGCA|nr:uncharacterized protein LOC131887388 isoform X2 [Tigriopus californicus]TRY70616.1 hypothetical protein TCAL_06130 [Tigriopus californicus]
MRVFTLSLVMLCLTAQMTQGQQGGGILAGLRNFFRPRRQQPQFRPPQNFNPPQGQDQGQRFVPQQQNFQAQQTFQPQQNFQPQQGFQSQSQQTFQPQQTFNPGPQAFSSNNQQSWSALFPNNRFVCSKDPADSNIPSTGCRPPGENPNDRESPRCPNASPNQIHSFDGKRVIYTWEIAGNCEKFTAIQADNYCKAQGGRAASLDTPERAKFFMDKLLGRRYMWTGGRIVHQCKTVFWPSGKTTQWTNTGVAPWSYTGGWEIAPNCTRGQPDNRNALRDQSDPEVCLGVLNNFYVDGIVWHDVACHHKKPTICELP